MVVKFKFINQLVGAFIIFTAGIVLLVGYYIVKEKKLFVTVNHYWTLVDSGDGLVSGIPVKLKGINIGYVDDVFITDEGKVKVKFFVFPEYVKFLRGNVMVKVSSSFPLGGKYLELIVDKEGEIPKNNSFIPYIGDVVNFGKNGKITHRELMDKINLVLEYIPPILEELKKTTAWVNNPHGDVRKTVRNVYIMSRDLVYIVRTMRKITPVMEKTMLDMAIMAKEMERMISDMKRYMPFKSSPARSSKNTLPSLDTRDF